MQQIITAKLKLNTKLGEHRLLRQIQLACSVIRQVSANYKAVHQLGVAFTLLDPEEEQTPQQELTEDLLSCAQAVLRKP